MWTCASQRWGPGLIHPSFYQNLLHFQGHRNAGMPLLGEGGVQNGWFRQSIAGQHREMRAHTFTPKGNLESSTDQ